MATLQGHRPFTEEAKEAEHKLAGTLIFNVQLSFKGRKPQSTPDTTQGEPFQLTKAVAWFLKNGRPLRGSSR